MSKSTWQCRVFLVYPDAQWVSSKGGAEVHRYQGETQLAAPEQIEPEL